MSAKVIVIGSVVFLLILIGGAFLLSSTQKSEIAAVNYSTTDNDRPKAEIDKNFVDVGDMKVSDEKTADFTLKNAGTKPMQILDMTSSCHCTFGQLIYKNLTTGQFSMGSKSGYITDIAPGDTATIKIIYVPSIMPVSGIIEREVYVTTNDPVMPRLIFSIQANVK